MTKWAIHKFGGTSVANAERYRDVGKILENPSICPDSAPVGVVVSAMSKITDRLIGLLENARNRNESYLADLDALRTRHLETVTSLLPPTGSRERILDGLEKDCAQLRELLRAVYLSRSFSEPTLELIAGHGEIWSAQILNAHLLEKGRRSDWLDAREVLVVKTGETGPIIDWEISKAKLENWLSNRHRGKAPEILVITGYVASTPAGVATTLKRNGSDFSASIFGALLESSAITIWTDVDGVFSADPNRVPEAVVLDEMSYDEAMELAYFGAKVIHPNTMAPALAQDIPIWIRNTFNPSHPGTKIHRRARSTSGIPVRGFSTMDRVALLNLEGTGMIGVPGVAQRLFGALREVDVSVIMISQASSEHSICFAVPEEQALLAKETVERAFFAELHHGQIQTIGILPSCSILAAVGDEMAEKHGVCARFFGALGKAGVSVRAIAQGSSERNISVVIDRALSTRALRAAHAGFVLSDQTLSIGVIGPGQIGSALLGQLRAQAPLLRRQSRIDLRVRGIADSRNMWLENSRIDLDHWKRDLSQKGIPTDLDAFVSHLKADHLPHAVIIDCTSSEEIAARYGQWLKHGVHVITPNKKANSGKHSYYQSLRALERELNSHYFYEATVGAGLPIITTIRDLVQTGDRILKIEGILSGTLSFLFNSLAGGRAFSEVVREARKNGYTEPDPRDDLSGMDFARKLIILGREMGLSLELSDIQIQSLVPPGLGQIRDVQGFLSRLAENDEEMAKEHREAESESKVLRYIGTIDPAGKSSVSLKRIPNTHPFARVQGTDNIIAFTTERYSSQPLIVQGPGAGPEVTAGGIFADLLRLAHFLGAPA